MFSDVGGKNVPRRLRDVYESKSEADKFEKGAFFISQIQDKGVERKAVISTVGSIRKIKEASAKLHVTRAISAARKAGYHFNGKTIKGDRRMDTVEQDKNGTIETVAKVVDKSEEEQVSTRNVVANNVELSELAAQIRGYAERVRDNIISIGKCFIEAKKQVAHGEWDAWVEQNTTFTRQTAHKFMQCAKRFKDVAPTRHLSSTQMMELLALPAPQTEAFFESNETAGTPVKEMTKTRLRTAIKEWKEAHSDTKPPKQKKKISEAEESRQDSTPLEESPQLKVIELKIRPEDEVELIKIFKDILQSENSLSEECKDSLQQTIDKLSMSQNETEEDFEG